MAELSYTAGALDNENRHTVTRGTGTSVLGSGQPAALIVKGSLSPILVRAAFDAAERVLREDLRAVSAAADLATSGSKVV